MRFFVLFVAALAPLQMGRAQVLYGSIVGNIKDASDAPVAGVVVTATSTETNQTRETTTDSLGAYSLPTLNAGTYDVKTTKSGFAVLVERGVPVTINTVTRVNLTLKIGAVTESVTVGAEGAPLQTDRSEVRAEVSSAELVNLPVPVGP